MSALEGNAQKPASPDLRHESGLERMYYAAGTSIESLVLRTGSTDSSVIGQIFVDQAFEFSDLRRYEEIRAFAERTEAATGKRPLIVDGGANIGSASIFFGLRYPSAMIVAFEPEPHNYALLTRNVAPYRAVPVPCALASAPGLVDVVDPGEGNCGFRTSAIRAASTTSAVNCVTIEEIFAAHGENCFPFIVKIDIEGAEANLFSTNLSWIERTPLLVVELHDWMLPRGGSAKPFFAGGGATRSRLCHRRRKHCVDSQ